MKKNQFRNSAFGVAKSTVDAERVKSTKKVEAHVVNSAVVEKTFNPFLESAPNYIKFLCNGILAHNTDLVESLGFFDYSVILSLPKEQQRVLVACFTVFVSVGGLLKSFEFFMLKSLRILSTMYVTPIWMTIVLDLKVETWCHFHLVVLSCAVNPNCRHFLIELFMFTSCCIGVTTSQIWVY